MPENPYSADADRAQFWDQGYHDGIEQQTHEWQEPLSEAMAVVYNEGVAVGEAVHNVENDAVAGELTLDKGVEWLADELVGAVGGLGLLVLKVLEIPGDIQLKQPEPDWHTEANDAGDRYAAFCALGIHEPGVGVSQDGYWAGPQRGTYQEAHVDAQQHSDDQAFVILCRADAGICAPVTGVPA